MTTRTLTDSETGKLYCLLVQAVTVTFDEAAAADRAAIAGDGGKALVALARRSGFGRAMDMVTGRTACTGCNDTRCLDC